MNKPKTFISERKKKKLEDLKKKIHLEIAYYQIESGITKNIQEYQDQVGELVNMILEGSLRYERENFDFTVDQIKAIREELFSLQTYDNLEVDD